MKNRKYLGWAFTAILPLYSCSKEEPSDPPTAVEKPAVVPASPTPTPIESTDNNANLPNSGLPQLPASGVPLGFTSWDDFNSEDPETRSQSILRGKDPAQDLLGDDPLCSVYILSAFLNKDGDASYVLRTSFKHNNQSHGWILVTVKNDSTRVTGIGSNGQDQIFLELANPGNLLSAKRMNLKWFHVNHFDTGVCENLAIGKSP